MDALAELNKQVRALSRLPRPASLWEGVPHTR
jgi:hypothetical protein